MNKALNLNAQAPAYSNGFIVAYGKTYGLNEKFMQYGFKLKKFGANWAWYRSVLSDKLWYWEQTVKTFGAGIETFYTADENKITDNLVEAKEVDKQVAASQPKEIPPHELDGAVFEVTKWYANQFKSNNNTQYAFRNLKVLKVKAESAKAYLVDAEFFSGIACTCGICGRQLDNAISKATGIGPICAEKIGMIRPTLETAQEVVKQLETMSKAQGTFNNVWIPKSQIKNTIVKE